jgi:anti-anti-sigma factor
VGYVLFVTPGVRRDRGHFGCRPQEGLMSDEEKVRRSDVLKVAVRYNGIKATLVLVGEFDMTGGTVFWAHFSEVLGTRPSAVTVDVRDLEFIDSSGFLALLRARHAAIEAGMTFRVADPSPMLRLHIELTGLRQLLLGE